MAYDLNFDGTPVFYSWPSKGSIGAYTVDVQTVAWSARNVKQFLIEFATTSQAEKVFLIAHSMGTRALASALTEISQESPDLLGKFSEIILAAPDIDAEIFKRDIAPAIVTPKTPTTVYVSARDQALNLSRELNGFARLGHTADGILAIPGIEVIDATNADTDFFGHSYYAESMMVMFDLFRLIIHGQRADSRNLERVYKGSQKYWQFKLPIIEVHVRSPRNSP
jgi:esterase/lipase superfamily enzyme